MPDQSSGGRRPYDSLSVHDHSCVLLEGTEERLSALLEYSRAGVRRAEKCLFLLSPDDVRLWRAWAEENPHAVGETAVGIVVVQVAQELGAWNQPFEEFLRCEIKAAEMGGFSALRLVFDIPSFLGKKPSAWVLLTFEQQLNAFLPRHRALALCLYDRRNLPSRILREALYSHPVLISEGRAIRNPAFELRGEEERDIAQREVEGMLRCLSEHRRLDLYLSEAEGRYRNLVQLSPEAIIVEVEGRITWINPAGLDLFGAAAVDDLLQRPFASLVLPEKREFLGYSREGGAPINPPELREEWLQRLDGEVFLGEVKRLPLLDRDGRAVLVLVRDISEGRRAEQALRRSHAETEKARDLVDGILQSVADGVIVTDLQHRIQVMNSAAEKMLRVRLADVANHPLSTVISNEHLREQFNIFSWQWGSEAQQVEFALPGAKGEGERIINARLSVMKGKKGKRNGVITVLQDVSFQRRFERMKNQLIATIAHELRTPLTAVMGFSEFLLMQRDGVDPAQEQEFLGEIFGQAVRLKKLVDNLMDVNRFESEQAISLVKSRCSLGDLLRLKIAQFQGNHPGHEMKLDLGAGEPGDFWLDFGKMEQVLENLLSNAVKYSPAGSQIILRGQPMGNYYLLIIQDHGIGMSAEQKERIFDKFYRVDQSNTAKGGIGLGMSLVRYIIRAHGGRIWVRSKPGEGTSVYFTLPLEK